jgi:hypothetical protein
MDLGKILKRVNLVRNLYWFIIYLSLSLGFFFGYITNSIKDYKMEKLDQFEATENFKNIEANYNLVKKELNELNSKNRNILLALNNSFSTTSLFKELGPYFKDVKVLNSSTSKDENYIRYEYQVSAKVSSPDTFYHFSETINKSENIIKIAHPITFTSSKNGIEVSFKVFIYELANK